MKIKIASKVSMIAISITAIVLCLGAYIWHEEHRPHILEMYVFDTKGGPSIFIRTPNDRRIIIGGGANSDIVRSLSGVLPFYSRSIDMVVAAHPDGAHVTGLIDVINRYEVGKVIMPSVTLDSISLASTTDVVYDTFTNAVSQRNIPIEKAGMGDRIVLDQSPSIGESNSNTELISDVTGDILFPAVATSSRARRRSSDDFAYSKTSAPEIIMRISYGATSIFILGDATPKVQRFIVATHPDQDLQSDVLVTDTNASAANISAELVSRVAPHYLVYSKATTNNPHSTADPFFSLLYNQRFNVREKGIVKVVSNGSDLKVQNSP